MKQNKKTTVILSPEGISDHTRLLQNALDSVWLSGGGTVELSNGVYYIGGVRLRSHTTLYLHSGCRIIASRSPEAYGFAEADSLEPLSPADRTEGLWQPFILGKPRDYSFLRAGSRWNHSIIRAIDAEDIAVIGESGSVIDGCDCYDSIGEEGYRGPHGIGLYRCKNITLRGYTIQNTGNWAHTGFYCQGILCEDITVLAGHDGVHFFGCCDITVRNSAFYTGDDCIAGFANLNTVVENCICNTACSGLRFGGTNVLIKNCEFFGPARYCFRGSLSLEEKKNGTASPEGRKNMLSVFTYYADHSIDIPELPENIVIKDCKVNNVDRLMHYNFSGNERWQSAKPLRSLSFESIEAQGVCMPLVAYGSPELLLCLSLKNVSIEFDGEMQGRAFMHIAFCESLELEGIKLSGLGDKPKILTWSPLRKLLLCGIEPPIAPECLIKEAQEPFTCRSI